MFTYDQEYARKYIEGTLSSPYTVYKNAKMASIFGEAGAREVWDLGGNVSGVIKTEGSLRFQLGKQGMEYRSIDLVPSYFNPEFALSCGQPSEFVYSKMIGTVGNLRPTFAPEVHHLLNCC